MTTRSAPSSERTPGPVTVLVPGLGLDDRAWERVRRRLSGRSRAILLPSLGRRAHRGADMTVERQAGRLLQALGADCADGFVLVGHSASCPVVVEAATRSRVVSGLVLVGPVTDPRAATWPRMLDQWLRTATHERPDEVPVLLPQYRTTGVPTMVAGMNAVRRYRIDRALGRLDLPLVVIRGAYDRIARHDWSHHLAERGGGRLDTVAGAAHMVPLTHPDSIAAAVHTVHTSVPASSPSARPGERTTGSESARHETVPAFPPGR